MPNNVEENYFENRWLEYRDSAVENAKKLNSMGVTKQLCNRLLEPFMWHTVILTATEFDNFFELRCPKYQNKSRIYNSKKDALNDSDGGLSQLISELGEQHWFNINTGQSEIHMMQLAECMWDARNESVPKQLQEGEWHIPFGDKIDDSRLLYLVHHFYTERNNAEKLLPEFKIKIATARCARVSYLNFEGKDDYKADIKLYDTLLKSGHYSPFEHCARVMSEDEHYSFYKGYGCNKGHSGLQENKGWCNNFRGFIQYRYLIENNLNF